MTNGSDELYNRARAGRFTGCDAVVITFDWMLGMLRGGSIIEIGMGPYSSKLISELAERRRATAYHCDTAPARWMEDLTGASRVYTGRSDDFFSYLEEQSVSSVAVCLIDGCHSHEQVRKDFWNVDCILKPHGLIVMHDTCPQFESKLGSAACGDAYIFRQELEANHRDSYGTITFPSGGYPDAGG